LWSAGEPTAPEAGAGHSISFPARLEEIGREKGVDPGDIEAWFADEARIGQKNKITRRWAKRGSRPSAPEDQRTASAYIFGAICPKEGKGAAPRNAALRAHAPRMLAALMSELWSPGTLQ